MMNTAIQLPQGYGVVAPQAKPNRAVLTTDGPFVAVKESLGGIPAVASELRDFPEAAAAEKPGRAS
jgi:hypothetical protein